MHTVYKSSTGSFSFAPFLCIVKSSFHFVFFWNKLWILFLSPARTQTLSGAFIYNDGGLDTQISSHGIHAFSFLSYLPSISLHSSVSHILDLLDGFSAFIHSINGWTAVGIKLPRMLKHFSIFSSSSFFFCSLRIPFVCSHSISFTAMPTSLYLVRSSLCVSFLFLVQFKTSVLFTDEDGFIQSVSLSLLKAAINTMGKYLKSTSTIENRETHFQNEEQKKEVLQANLKFCNSGKSSFVHVCIWWSLYLSRLKTRSKFRFWIKYTHTRTSVLLTLSAHCVGASSQKWFTYNTNNDQDSMSIFQKAFDGAAATSCEFYTYSFIFWPYLWIHSVWVHFICPHIS